MKFDEDLNGLEIEKENIRNNKKRIDEQVVGKNAQDLNETLVKQSLMQLRELEKILDALIQKENDILIIDRQRKTFSEIEKDMCLDYFKRCKHLKDSNEHSSYSI